MSTGALLEHLNLNVIDKETARAFYVDVLGGAMNPITTNQRQVHVNFGISQFHLPFKRTAKLMDPVVDAQEWNGDVSLSTTMSKSELLSRAEKSKYAKVIEVSSDFVKIQGPYGNIFSLFFLKQENVPDLKSKYRCHAGGYAATVLLNRARHFVLPSNAEKIAGYYRDVLGFKVVQDRKGIVKIPFGLPGVKMQQQMLIFEENEEEADSKPDAYDRIEKRGYHVAIYFDSHDKFLSAFDRCQRLGNIYENKRFVGMAPEFASSMTRKQADETGQFRIKDLIDPKTKELALVLEHEIRSPRHRCCPFVTL